jgi:predicted permease
VKPVHEAIGFWSRVRALLHRRRLARDIDDEVAFHLAMKEADSARHGASDPARAARRRFGNVGARKEEVWDLWTFPSLESVVQDVKYAFRSLVRDPGFTFVAVFVLALGIGANTAIYSLVHSVFVRGLPFPSSERLVVLIGNVERTTGVERRGGSYPDFVDWRAQAKSFEDMAVFDSTTRTLVEGNEPERVPLEAVSSQYFAILGVKAAVGRSLQSLDEGPEAAPVVMLSDGLWKRRFGGDPAVIGRTVRFGTDVATIVGVARPGFRGVNDQAEAWLPYFSNVGAGLEHNRGNRGIQVVGRLARGVVYEQAQAEIDGIARSLAKAYPDTNEKRGVELSPLAVEVFGDLREALSVLMAAVTFVLFLACTNVANLLIGRSETRRREIAVRAALGAGRGRLWRQLLTESLVLSGLGATAGIGVALVALRVLVATSPVTLPSFVRPGLEPWALAFSAGLATLCGVVLGLAPAAHARPDALGDALKTSARGGTGARSQHTRAALVIAEVSLAVVLLVSAGLMIRSMGKLLAVDPGFDPRSVLTLSVNIPRLPAPASTTQPGQSTAPASPPPLAVPAQALLERVRAIPGVVAASLASDVPLGGSSSAVFFSAEGDASSGAQKVPRAYVHRVSPEFFETLRIPLRAGRALEVADALEGRSVAVVSENLVMRFWPDEDPIGKRIRIGPESAPWIVIVGVVPDVKYRGLPRNPTADPDMYFPFADRSSQALVVRTSVPPQSVAAPIRAALRQADPGIVVYNVAPMTELVVAQTESSRFTSWLLGLFAVTALVLAAVGIYGVMSYLVTLRQREFGIRLVLGARRAQLVRLVAREGAGLVAIGVALGVVGSFALYRLMRTQLFEVSAVDPAAAASLALLATVALVACCIPAIRASRTDPAVTLRME